MIRINASLFALISTQIAASTALADAPAIPPPDVPIAALGEGAIDNGDARVETRLIADVETVAPGETFRVGVLFSMDPHWHVYWQNPGQAAYSTEVSFGSDDASFEEHSWVAPDVFSSSDGFITTFGYEEEVLLFAEARASEAAEGSIIIYGVADYLSCRVDCVPGRAEMTLEIPVGGTVESHFANDYFEPYAARVPRQRSEVDLTIETAISQSAIRPGDSFEAAIGVIACDGPSDECEPVSVQGQHVRESFVPERTPQIDWVVSSVSEHPNAFQGVVVHLEGRANRDPVQQETAELGGVLRLERGGEPLFVEVREALLRAPVDAELELTQHPLFFDVNNDVEGSGDAISSQTSSTVGRGEGANTQAPVSIWKAIALALLGGMLLNLMPCVLPVLALKVMGFTKIVHDQHGNVAAHALAYTGGIVLSMLVLAATVLALRAGGIAVGWGFQFQEPAFVLAICAIVIAFAMNLFGVFEVSVGAAHLDRVTQESTGLRRSAFEGVLTVALATPCSAPFLGTAVGFALASNAVTIVAIFAALGVGLALPFVVLTLVPGMDRVVPKPGLWMNHLKVLLGFALVATAVWLVSIVGATRGVPAMTAAIAAMTAVAFGTWLYGIAQRSLKLPTLAGLVAAALVSAVAIYVAAGIESQRPELPATSAIEASSDTIAWQAWSPEAVQAALADGRPVFVDFTAEWCITCKVNEERVINQPEIAQLAYDHDIAMFVADWTERDEEIRQTLADYGKGGVPMYLVYSPDSPEAPALLPELLTSSILQSALRESAP